MKRKTSIGNRALLLIAAALTVMLIGLFAVAPFIAAGGLLYPARHESHRPTPSNCEERQFKGDGVTLSGWRCRAVGERRAIVVYLHGIADNRDSSAGVVQRFTANGMDVIAYDSRRHGTSEGEICTYGFFEKYDLRMVLDGLEPAPVVLVGTSLGAAVALQEAAFDRRVKAVVAAEVFSDLETIARERAPFFLPNRIIRRAFDIAEQRGGFDIQAVSPTQAARSIQAPVLLIHGDTDTETPADHSRRVFAALSGVKRLILVPGARHNESLSGPGIWAEIDRWIDDALNHALPGQEA